MKVLWMVLAVFLSWGTEAQDLIERNASTKQKSAPLLKSSVSHFFTFDQYQKRKDSYGQVYLNINRRTLKSTDRQKIKHLAIPVSQTNYIYLDLEPTDIYSSEARIFDSKDQELDLTRGNLYTGVVNGENETTVSLAVYQDDINLIISDTQGNYNIGREEGSDRYVLFNDQKLGNQPFTCQADDLKKNLPEKIKKLKTRANYKSNGCIKIYIEADYKTYTNFDSDPQKVLNFIEGSFAEVAQLFAQIGITLKISDIKIWTSQDPYGGQTDVSGALNTISSQVRNFNGDLMHLISAKGNCCGWSGVAYVNYNSATGKFNGSTACGANPYGVSQTSLFYESLPAYSWTVNVLAHEIGHNLGAPHTHECMWGTNYDQALDACAPSGGNCANPGIPSSGTIMSYCHTRTGVGIDLGNGFHPQVAQHLLSEYNNRTCLTPCSPVDGCMDPESHEYNPIATIDDGSCESYCSDSIKNGDETDIDCGGTLCDPCPILCDESLYILEIILDRYGEEFSWDLKDENGNILHQGGVYTGRPEGSVETVPLCLEDGEYTLTVYDSYGDGMCCQYGNGSYTLYDPEEVVIIEGAEFDREETTVFVVSSHSCYDCIANVD